MPTELVAQIQRRIKMITSDQSPIDPELQAAVERTGALPLMTEAAGGFSLLPNGEIISFLWDDTEIEPVKDPRVINVVLFQGCKRYPELSSIVPTRPPDATECPHCAGTGYPIDSPPNIENMVCYCGGLGWIPPGDSGGKFETDRPRDEHIG
ncbi:MAG TPA: hypothetical protein VEZ90_18910 [Blastocatellia bacterium]|nr:hypothetical protein [Blastocatellia bacterium]